MPPTPDPPRQAVLLVGGRGTRMWPLTATTPKGLLPLAGIPFVEYQLRQLAAIGIAEVVLAIGEHGRTDWEAYAATSPLDLDVSVSVEDSPLDTAGPVRAVLDRLDDRFLVLNGDVVVETDLSPLAGGTRSATIGLIEVEDTSAYGVVVVDGSGGVTAFVEKPPMASAPARTVNAGVYLLERGALAGYPLGPLSFERVVFPDLVARRELGAVVLAGHWIDIGTPELYLAAHELVHRGASTLHRPGSAHVGGGATVDGTLGGSWAWVGPGAVIEAGAVVSEAVVMPGARIEAGAEVVGAVIGSGATVSAGSRVCGGSLVGAGAIIGAGCEIDAGMRVAPGVHLAAGSVTFRPPR